MCEELRKLDYLVEFNYIRDNYEIDTDCGYTTEGKECKRKMLIIKNSVKKQMEKL